MALQADNYVIYNESTGTLLALAANCNRALVGTPTLYPMASSNVLTRALLVGGWGWDDGDGQKVGDEALSAGAHILTSAYAVGSH
jgi:hypothetical protein